MKAARSNIYPHIQPDIEQWPIYKQSQNRTQLIEEIIQTTLDSYQNIQEDTLESILNKSIYLEKQRVRLEPWKVDPPNEKVFWTKAKKRLDRIATIEDKEEKKAKSISVLKRVIERYAEEIVGSFNKRTFYFARRFLTVLFKGLFDKLNLFDLLNIGKTRSNCIKHLKVYGPVEKIRSLFEHGTVVILPTHSSNLDSIMIGYMLDSVVGLPAFSYGAGLNLYNSGIAAYFMNRLGAYRVDRRKKNPIYLDTLVNMSSISVEDGTNTIFFPGGTRSRDGSLETKLKLGLLGSVIDAQRVCLEKGNNNKIFIVPLVISYETVLEAGILIEQNLRKAGKEKYSSQINRQYTFSSVLKFAYKLYKKRSDVYFSFGEPIDVLANTIDEQGKSYDKYGKMIDIKSYFQFQGNITQDDQRESEYTKILGKNIGEIFLKDNIILPSHFIAFTAIELLLAQHNTENIYHILKLPINEWSIPFDQFLKCAAEVKDSLNRLCEANLLKLSEHFEFDLEKLINYGIRTSGIYHTIKPIEYSPKEKELKINDLPVIYFYRNRLSNYELNEKIKWSQFLWTDKYDKEVID